MARQNGRDLRILNSFNEVIGVATTKTLNINNSPVDVTGDDDAGFVTLLSRPGTKQITADITFVFDSEKIDLLENAVTGVGLLDEYTIQFLTNADASVPEPYYSITGDFYLATVSITGASDGRIEGTASLQSSGPWEKTST